VSFARVCFHAQLLTDFSSFSDITSHEIRNPTSAIIGEFASLDVAKVRSNLTSRCLLLSAATDLLRSNINDMLSKVTIGSRMLFTPESVATLEDDVSSIRVFSSSHDLPLTSLFCTRYWSSIRFISPLLFRSE